MRLGLFTGARATRARLTCPSWSRSSTSMLQWWYIRLHLHCIAPFSDFAVWGQIPDANVRVYSDNAWSATSFCTATPSFQWPLTPEYEAEDTVERQEGTSKPHGSRKAWGRKGRCA